MEKFRKYYADCMPRKFEGVFFGRISKGILEKNMTAAAHSFYHSYNASIVHQFVCSMCPLCENQLVKKHVVKANKSFFWATALLYKCTKQNNELVGFLYINESNKCEQHESSSLPKYCDILYKHERARNIAIRAADMSKVEGAIKAFRESLPEKIDFENAKAVFEDKQGREYELFNQQLQPENYENALIALNCHKILCKIQKSQQ